MAALGRKIMAGTSPAPEDERDKSAWRTNTMREVGNERCGKKNDTGGRKSSYPRISDAAVNGVASHFGNRRIIATPSPAQKVVVWTKNNMQELSEPSSQKCSKSNNR